MAKIHKNVKLIIKLVEASFTGGKLNPTKVKKIIAGFKKLPQGSAIGMLSLYMKVLKHELDKHRLVIEAPHVLSKQQTDKIAKIVSKTTKVFETEMIVNKALLGGFRLRIGDEVVEDSLERRIEEVRKVIRS